MNARNIIKSLALVAALASPLVLGGCTQRLIIEEQTPETDSNEPIAESSSDHSESAIGNRSLYVRSGNVDPGETQAGPHPEPWQRRLGPHPEPWRRDGQGDDGTSPPPPPSNDPDPDPNPKP